MLANLVFSPTVTTTSPAGHVTFRVTNNAPVTTLQVRLVANHQVIGDVPNASELRDVEGMKFTMPAVRGSYDIEMYARDAFGCEAVTTVKRTVTVQ